MNTLAITDSRASLGDLQGALRGLWADIVQEQGCSLTLNDIAAYALPDTFKGVAKFHAACRKDLKLNLKTH